MVYSASFLLILAAIACLGLSRRVATRSLGWLAALAALAAAGLIGLGQAGIVALTGGGPTWMQFDALAILIGTDNRPEFPALLVLIGAAGALLALALALPATVRGFGSLFGWLLLAAAAALIGLASNPLFAPFIWGTIALLSYSAVRASGALSRSEALPRGVTFGLLAALVATGGLLPAYAALAAGQPVPLAALAAVVVGVLILVGLPPFHSTFDELTTAPAALGGLLFGAILPVVAFDTLLRLTAQLTTLPFAGWSAVLSVVGGLGALICGLAALQERSLRRIVAWQASGQASWIVVAVGLTGGQALLAATALLASLLLTTLAGALAATSVALRAGSDDYTALPAAQWPAGLAWALAAAAGLGLPPFWGFWGRWWLYDVALAQTAWVVPILIASSVLAFLAYLAPLAGLWRRSVAIDGAPPADGAAPSGWGSVSLALVFVALLLLAGLAPQLLWNGWLQFVPGGPAALPVGAGGQVVALLAAIGWAAAALMLRGRTFQRRVQYDNETPPVVLGPEMLGALGAPVAALGRASDLWQAIWRGLLAASNAVRLAISLFEQRYYLAGILIGIISVILLMAQ